MKKIEGDTKKWKIIPCSGIERRNTVIMSTLPKAIFGYYTIPINTPAAFWTELEQKILKFICNPKRA